MLKNILFTIKAFCISLIFVIASTYGWRPVSPYTKELQGEESASAKRMKFIVEKLAGEIGNRNYASYENLEASAAFITRSFKELGYDVKQMKYDINGQEFENIIAESPTSKDDRQVILIGAHYDSCFNPGADDNASGVAGLIELARLFKDIDSNYRFQFVAFTNEEPPHFLTEEMGSLVFAHRAREMNEPIKVAIILEMLGYYSEEPFSQKYLPLLGPFFPNKANFVAIVGNFASKTFVHDLYKGFKESRRFPVERLVSPEFIPGVYFSDHWSFWQVDYPAVMITDTAYLRSKHYHQQTDLPDTLNYEKMAKAVHGLKEAITYLSTKKD